MTDADAEKEREIERASALAMQELGDLAINILRIVRGAGEPQKILRQTADYVSRAIAYHDLTGFDFTGAVITKALSVSKTCPEILRTRKFALDGHNAQETAISGSLQVAASRLHNDHLREAKGILEMDRAFEVWCARGR